MSIKEIHYRYWLAICMTVLVGFATVKWHDIPKVAELLSFGLSLSSLALAFVAIFQAMLSSFESQKSAETMSQSLASIQSAAETARLASETTESVSNSLRDAFHALPDHVATLSAKLDRAQEGATAVDPRGIISEDKNSPATQTEEEDLKKKKVITHTTLGGNVALYLCAKSITNNIKFSVNDIKFQDGASSSYVSGYIMAWYAAEFIAAEYKDKTFLVHSIGDMVAERVLEFLEERRKNNKYLQQNFDIIDRYLETKDPEE